MNRGLWLNMAWGGLSFTRSQGPRSVFGNSASCRRLVGCAGSVVVVLDVALGLQAGGGTGVTIPLCCIDLPARPPGGASRR